MDAVRSPSRLLLPWLHLQMVRDVNPADDEDAAFALDLSHRVRREPALARGDLARLQRTS